jgi:hypothetical protein
MPDSDSLSAVEAEIQAALAKIALRQEQSKQAAAAAASIVATSSRKHHHNHNKHGMLVMSPISYSRMLSFLFVSMVVCPTMAF